ncbi:MAG: hypothetical protein R6U98_06340 [Pirellulaceae bacterium]
MESCPTQAVLPLVGLAGDKVIRDQYNWPLVRQLHPTTKRRFFDDTFGTEDCYGFVSRGAYGVHVAGPGRQEGRQED